MDSIIEKCALATLAVVIRIISVLWKLYSTRFYFQRPKRCPPISNPLLLRSACQLCEEMRNRTVSSETVVKAYISRIKDVNPIINAVMEERFEMAIKEAKNVDQLLIESQSDLETLKVRYPLLGIPVTVKESIAVQHLSYSIGVAERKDLKATDDADVVKLLRNSGAIVLLVSTTPEWCASLETFNYIKGTTCNPYDTRRTSGGSSGGEAALISSGASVIGIGSDYVGSIRVPASFCGIWGHKPSSQSVSLKGHTPTSKYTHFRNMLSLGPLTRYHNDLQLILNVIFKKNLKLLPLLDLKDVTVYTLHDYNFKHARKVEPEILLAINKIANHLKVYNSCNMKKITLPKLIQSSRLHIKTMVSTCGFENMFENFPKNYFVEFLLHLVKKSNTAFTHVCMGMLSSIGSWLPENIFRKTKDEAVKLRKDLTDLLGTNGVLLLPTQPTAANFHNGASAKLYDYGYTAIINILGFPATQCPVGFNYEGLPIGVQVVATANNDRLTLRVAEEIDKLFGGWVAPPSL